MVIDQTWEDRLSAGLNDAGLLGKIRFARSHPREAVSLDYDCGIVDGFAAISVYEARTPNNDWTIFPSHELWRLNHRPLIT
jgi:hypothetical protein